MNRKRKPVFVEDDSSVPKPGAHVDSISYYTRLLVEANREMFLLQEHKKRVAETGNTSVRAGGFSWFIKVVDAATDAATTIIKDSEETNELGNPHDSTGVFLEDSLPLAERMTSFYGSFGSGGDKQGTPELHRGRKHIPAENSVMLTSDPALASFSFELDELDAAQQKRRRGFNRNRKGGTQKRVRLVEEDHLVRPMCWSITRPMPPSCC